MSAVVKSWRLHRRVNSTEADLARMVNPIVRGWMAYYGAFFHTELTPVLDRINTYLLRWIMKKYKRAGTLRRARQSMAQAAARNPRYFAHWIWVKPAVK
ncbi:group II intron maturase-specific domain-containing protein [Streptomyces sp. NBC_00019]|uniref:group II intron maturase-specific domain-containing protein n=1 Tax=Streptomyces sp. NBC_00019 TaxID=2975623 RepID=UPI0032540F6D